MTRTMRTGSDVIETVNGTQAFEARTPAALDPSEELVPARLEPSALVATWDAPSWASERSDDVSLVEHSHCFGEVMSVNGENLPIHLVQFEQLDLDASPIVVIRGPLQIRVDGVRLNRTTAHEFRRLFDEALAELDRHPDPSESAEAQAPI